MKCENFETIIADYIYNELNDSQKQEFEKHLETCEKCKSNLEAYKKVIEASKKNIITPDLTEINKKILEEAEENITIDKKYVFTSYILPLAMIFIVGLSAVIVSQFTNNDKSEIQTSNVAFNKEYPLSESESEKTAMQTNSITVATFKAKDVNQEETLEDLLNKNKKGKVFLAKKETDKKDEIDINDEKNIEIDKTTGFNPLNEKASGDIMRRNGSAQSVAVKRDAFKEEKEEQKEEIKEVEAGFGGADKNEDIYKDADLKKTVKTDDMFVAEGMKSDAGIGRTGADKETVNNLDDSITLQTAKKTQVTAEVTGGSDFSKTKTVATKSESSIVSKESSENIAAGDGKKDKYDLSKDFEDKKYKFIVELLKNKVSLTNEEKTYYLKSLLKMKKCEDLSKYNDELNKFLSPLEIEIYKEICSK